MSADSERHWVYGTAARGTIHLIRFSDAAKYPNPAPICGKRGPVPLSQGDETLSGHVATCRRCRKLSGQYEYRTARIGTSEGSNDGQP